MQVKEEPVAKKLPVQQKVAVPVRKEPVVDQMIPLESFYYGMFETGTENDSAAAVTFEANVSSIELNYSIPISIAIPSHPFQCPECHELLKSNNEFMSHIKRHANDDGRTETSVQCRYCLQHFDGQSSHDEHVICRHPLETKANHEYYCVICWVSFD